MPLSLCRLCNAKDLVSIIDLGSQPLSGVFPLNSEANPPSSPLIMVRCDACGLVQLDRSFDASQMYGDSYGYRSGANQTMRNHLTAVSRWLVNKVEVVDGDLVVDIGSNDGTFLNNFKGINVNRIGIDPCIEKYEDFYDHNIIRISDFFKFQTYPEEFVGRAKLVTTMAMFYDLENPVEFAREINSILSPDGFWFFEQSYAPWMQQSGAYDAICHEHLEYYSLSDIKKICDLAGFTIVSAFTNSINGGSLAVLAQKNRVGRTLIQDPYATWLIKEERRTRVNTLERWQQFSEVVKTRRDSLRDMLLTLQQSGNTIFGLGASTKGNVLLNYSEIDENLLPKIGEINPYKFGRVTPGSRIPIVDENEVLQDKPDFLMLLPWHFREEALTRYSKYFKEGGRLILPLPNVEIIGF